MNYIVSSIGNALLLASLPYLLSAYQLRVDKRLLCDYPPPFTFRGRQICSTYLGVSYICDPEAMISRTEAEAIDTLVSSKFHSCVDCLTHSDCHRHNFTIGIAFLRNSRACVTTGELMEFCGWGWIGRTNADQTDRFQSPADMGRLLANRIRNVWSTDRCETDLLILLIGNWLTPDNRLINDHPNSHVFVAFSSRLSHLASRLPKLTEGRKLPSLSRLISWLHKQSQMGTEPVVPVATDSILQQTAKSFGCIPIWALVIFGFCSLTGLLCAALGIQLNKTPRMKASQHGNALSIRYANSRWKAGFAGGVLNSKLANNTSKEETTTKRLAPMMFRQFTQVKTTKVRWKLSPKHIAFSGVLKSLICFR